MSIESSNGQEGSAQAPPGYRRAENHNGEEQWIHEETGLCVDLLRYARPTQMQDPETSRIDHYEFRLVIRPDGPGESGAPVDRTKEPTRAEPMARDWMREHPDGAVDLAEEQLEVWER